MSEGERQRTPTACEMLKSSSFERTDAIATQSAATSRWALRGARLRALAAPTAAAPAAPAEPRMKPSSVEPECTVIATPVASRMAAMPRVHTCSSRS